MSKHDDTKAMARDTDQERPPKTNNIITLASMENITKFFGDKIAVNKLNLSIKSREILGLIGPNGAGKSTAIRILSGLEINYSGKVTTCLLNPKQNMTFNMSMGYLPQHVAFPGWRTTAESLKLLARLSGIPEESLRNRVAEVLEFVDLSAVANSRCATLSGGMVQRLGFAQAIIHKPKLLILDEPFNHLDPQGRIQFKKMLSHLKDEGTGIIFSSHILSDVEEVANRVALINNGNLIFDSAIEDLLSKSNSDLYYELTVFNETEQLQEDIRNYQHIKSIERIGNCTYRITFKKQNIGTNMINSFLTFIIDNGYPISEFRQSKRTLENVFEILIGKE
jgi:ABC-2 type transport system ATP-binding protein